MIPCLFSLGFLICSSKVVLLLGHHVDNNWRNTPICFFNTLSVAMCLTEDSSTFASTCIDSSPPGTLPAIFSWLYPATIGVNPRASKGKQLKPVFIYIQSGANKQKHVVAKPSPCLERSGEKANHDRVPRSPDVKSPRPAGMTVFAPPSHCVTLRKPGRERGTGFLPQK